MGLFPDCASPFWNSEISFTATLPGEEGEEIKCFFFLTFAKML